MGASRVRVALSMGAIIATLLFASPMWADTATTQSVTARPGDVTRANDSGGGHDSVSAAQNGAKYSIDLNPPSGWSFYPFNDGDTPNFISLIDCTNAVASPEGSTAIHVDIPAPSGYSANTFPMRAWGKLTSGGSGGSGSGGSGNHWSAGPGVHQVKIIAVPKNVYSGATAAVPVKFQVTGFGDTVDIMNVTVAFYVGGKLAFQASPLPFGAAVSKTSVWDANGGDGTGAADNGGAFPSTNGNGGTDTYVAWVTCDSTTFGSNSCQTNTHFAQDSAFVVTVMARAAQSGSDYVNVQSDYPTATPDPARPKVFADNRVMVYEIGTTPNGTTIGKSWSISDTTTCQPDMSKVGTAVQECLWTNWTKSPPIPYTCPLDHNHDDAHNLFNWTSDFVYVGNPVGSGWTYLTSSIDSHATLHSATGPWIIRSKVRTKVAGNTVGAYFAVSYPQIQNVSVVGGPGMRLYNISGAYTSNMTMFPDGKGSVTQTVDNGVDTTYALGVSSAGLGIAAALAGPISGAWSCAFWVGCEACSFAQNVSSAQSDGAAEAALQSYIIQITDDQIFIPNAQRTDANIPVNTIPNCCTKQNTTSIGPIGTGQQGIAVGFVYEIHLQSSAAISACMNAISSRDAEAEAQYSWSVGKDTFSIVSSSN